ncbi:MAG: hypothetical protein IPJ68_04180 [Candidatus Moraniibacteriota bacterium]|nr:MAG: hypothetical protein IPJ68_04180 [Candidatus Moranbacteria bacterium]
MSGKFTRYSVIGLSALLLMASVGVIFWIVRDEQIRLAERERQALEAAEAASQQEKALESAKGETESGDVMATMLHDIDILLSGLSSDDLPSEN